MFKNICKYCSVTCYCDCCPDGHATKARVWSHCQRCLLQSTCEEARRVHGHYLVHMLVVHIRIRSHYAEDAACIYCSCCGKNIYSAHPDLGHSHCAAAGPSEGTPAHTCGGSLNRFLLLVGVCAILRKYHSTRTLRLPPCARDK